MTTLCNYPDCNCPTENPCLQGKPMTTNQNTEALRLAGEILNQWPMRTVAIEAAAELRRLVAENESLQKELEITDKLLEQSNQVLKAIPPCPAHGSQCIPNAMEWINRMKNDSQNPKKA